MGLQFAKADHRDATNELADPRTNLGDVYAFVSSTNPNNVVLAMTVNGFTVPGPIPVFAPGCLYQFKIDNTGDFVEDLAIQFFFDKPAGFGFVPTQNFTMVGPIKPPKVGGITTLAKTKTTPITDAVKSSIGNEFTSINGLKIFCGLRDDPLFIDEIPVRNILRAGAPIPAQTRNPPGIDYHAGLNCSVIAIELPSSLLVGTLNNSSAIKQLNIWATTNVSTSVARALRSPVRGEPVELRESASKSYVQIDRAALAGVSTFLVSDGDKNAFCSGQPKDDVKFFSEPAWAIVEHLQLTPTATNAMLAADQILATHFPDVVRLDVSGTANLGRRPFDDVVDRELNALTLGVLTTDTVNANDVPFLTTFPFFAPLHGPQEAVPRRN